MHDVTFGTMPYVDNDELNARDVLEAWDKSKPFRFGEKTEVNLGLDNSGSWRTLGNGDRIWNIGIRSVGAYSINLIFSEYELPAGS